MRPGALRCPCHASLQLLSFWLTQLRTAVSVQGMDLLQDLTSIEPAIVLNAAFCERQLKECSYSPELQQKCAEVPCASTCTFYVLTVLLLYC